MQKLSKSGKAEAFIAERWTQDTLDERLQNGIWLLPAKLYKAASATYPESQLGLLVAPDDELEDLADTIHKAALVAVDFPVFTDGRGFSQCRLVRDTLRYNGEIVAVGSFMQDQLFYLKRCGFDAFVVADDADLSSLTASLNDFSDAYQASSDQPLPLFRRRLA